jgi:hypothetical protein
MEAEKLGEIITKTGSGEKNPHIIKAFIISLFAVVLSFAGLGSSEELKTISADNVIESNYQTISEFRSLKQSVLQVTIDQLEINLGMHSSLSSAEKSNINKIIENLKKEIKLSESNIETQDGKKEIGLKLQQVQNEKKISISKNKSFEYGEALLQIAIVLISTSIISSIGGLVLGGTLIGTLGVLAVANGYFLLILI